MGSEGNTAVAIASDIAPISREELRRRLGDPSLTIVDVLPEVSYVSAHIPGAINIPVEELASRARELLPDSAAEIVTYCGNLSCDRSAQAASQLQEMGYSNVRDYREGLADWTESGGPTESVAAAPPQEDSAAIIPGGPPLLDSPGGVMGRGPARVTSMDTHVLRLIERRSTLQLFLIWLGLISLSAIGYWLVALTRSGGLFEAGAPVSADLKGFASALYFSFVTATSIGYGDIVPRGFVRVIAVSEAVAGLILFGAVVAKFVSHRQDELVREIYSTTFEERLDRLQTNLHLVLSELLSIAAISEAPQPNLQRLGIRLDSALMVFLGEVRAIRDLLYQPRLVVEEGELAAILASLASDLTVLAELVHGLPPEFVRTESQRIVLERLASLANDICGNCVPHEYTPRLVFWMDRIQATAQRIK